jgi:hypothetical protein
MTPFTMYFSLMTLEGLPITTVHGVLEENCALKISDATIKTLLADSAKASRPPLKRDHHPCSFGGRKLVDLAFQTSR